MNHKKLWAIQTLEIELHRLLGEQRHMEAMSLSYLDDRIKPSDTDRAKLNSVRDAITQLKAVDCVSEGAELMR